MWSYNYSDTLYHYGTKGMKWGVRKDADRVPRSTRRKARKDAIEFTNAKMYYGEGAGNRRKLIKNTVEQRSKDPVYKREFEKNLANQDMAKAAAKAKRTRVKNDAKNSVAKNARGVMHLTRGDGARVAASAAAIYGAARFIHSTGLDKKALNAINTTTINRGRSAASGMFKVAK